MVLLDGHYKRNVTHAIRLHAFICVKKPKHYRGQVQSMTKVLRDNPIKYVMVDKTTKVLREHHCVSSLFTFYLQIGSSLERYYQCMKHFFQIRKDHLQFIGWKGQNVRDLTK